MYYLLLLNLKLGGEKQIMSFIPVIISVSESLQSFGESVVMDAK